MRALLPWRVRKVVSDRFPLAYHLIANAGLSGNDAAYWDEQLANTWDARDWPTKVERILALTRSDDAILDVGCGNGSILRRLATHGYDRLHGFEISDYAVTRLRSEGIAMWQGKLPELCVPDAHFDVVIASQVLEHVIRRRRFAHEIDRVLKPGGRALIFVPDDCLGPIDEPEHVIRYDAASLRRFLARTFEVVSVESMRDANFAVPVLFAQVRKVAS
ncbi:MAG: methyltransferase domain-containing protein [Burkholderiaceae bacterium]